MRERERRAAESRCRSAEREAPVRCSSCEPLLAAYLDTALITRRYARSVSGHLRYCVRARRFRGAAGGRRAADDGSCAGRSLPILPLRSSRQHSAPPPPRRRRRSALHRASTVFGCSVDARRVRRPARRATSGRLAGRPLRLRRGNLAAFGAACTRVAPAAPLPRRPSRASC